MNEHILPTPVASAPANTRKVFIKTGISSRTQLRGLDLDG